MFAPSRFLLICSIAVITLGLTGCGQKGPLFMPVKQPVTAPSAAAAKPNIQPNLQLPVQPAMPSAPTTADPATGAAPQPR